MQNEEDSVYVIECVQLTQPAFLIIIDINKSLEPLWPSTYASVPYKKAKRWYKSIFLALLYITQLKSG